MTENTNPIFRCPHCGSPHLDLPITECETVDAKWKFWMERTQNTDDLNADPKLDKDGSLYLRVELWVVGQFENI